MEKWMFFLLIYYDKKKHRVKYFLLTIFRRASPIGTRSFFLILIFSRFFKNTCIFGKFIYTYCIFQQYSGRN